VGGSVSLLRFPKSGGPVQAYDPDSLGAATWSSLGAVPALRRVLGADVGERVAWAVDANGGPVSVDLESRLVRRLPGIGVSVGVVGPDGSLYLAGANRKVVRVARRTPVEFHDSLPAPPRALFGAVNDLLVAVTAGRPSRMVSSNAGQIVYSAVIPEGEVAASYWGDLLAVAADSAVLLYETLGRRPVATIRPRHSARDVAFSPSGHRLYVAGTDPVIEVYDRYSQDRVATIELTGAPRAIRMGASGRWLLVRPATDSVWVVDLATNHLIAAVAGDWGADLPLVAGSATLVVRQGNDVASFDLRQVPPRRMAVLRGGGADLWIPTAWVPRERVLAAVAKVESATVAQDSALISDSSRTDADSSLIYLQVSSSQNPDWSEELAKQLKTSGFPASVLPPKGEEEGYRVVVGPYPSEEAAVDVGRKLGRAYFVLRQPVRRP
jgi:sporulation related protein